MISQRILDLLETPPVEWKNKIDGMSHSTGSKLTGEMERLIERLVILSSYIDHRTYWNEEHSDAVKEAIKKRKAVRKALGFTYPESGSFTF